MSRQSKVLFRHVRQFQHYGTTKGQYKRLRLIQEVEQLALNPSSVLPSVGGAFFSAQHRRLTDFIKKQLRKVMVDHNYLMPASAAAALGPHLRSMRDQGIIDGHRIESYDQSEVVVSVLPKASLQYVSLKVCR